MQVHYTPRQSRASSLTSLILGLSFLIFSSILVFALALPVSANSEEVQDGPVLLTVHGNLSNKSDEPIKIDLKILTGMESTSIITNAPWLEGAVEFKGVRISTFLKNLGAKSNTFEALAVNDYRFTLSDIDFDKYPIIIAYEKNNVLLDIRSQGPLLIMFPFDDYPELLTERNKAASVWQLIEMHIL